MGKSADRGGAMMKRVIFLIIVSILFLNPASAYSADPPGFRDEWLHLLKTGNEREKRLALASLWFLEYPENRKDPSILPLIVVALKEKDPSMREAAAEALGRIGGSQKSEEEKVIPALLSALEDPSPRVREVAVRAFARWSWRDRQGIAPLIRKLGDPSPWVRISAAYSLGELKTQEAVEPLLELMEDDSDWRFKYVQQEALIALRKIGILKKPLIAMVVKKFQDKYLKIDIIKIIGDLKIIEAKELLAQAARDSHDIVRKKALNALSELVLISQHQDRWGSKPRTVDDPYATILISSLHDHSAEIRAQSAEALGKSQDRRAIPALIDALNDTSIPVKKNAMKALGNFPDERIFDAAIHYIQTHPNDPDNHLLQATFISVARKTSRQRAYSFLSEGKRHLQSSLTGMPRGTPYREMIVHPHAVQKLFQAIENSDPRVPQEILGLLGSFADDRIEGYLLHYLESPYPGLRRTAASLLEDFAGDQAFPKLANILKDGDPKVKAATAKTLGALKDGRGLNALVGLSGDPSPEVREAAAGSLGAFNVKRALDALVELSGDPNARVRAAGLRSLGGFDEKKVLDLMVEHLKDESTSVQGVAVLYLKDHPDPRAVEPLIALLGQEDTFLPGLAAEALGKIGDKKALQPLMNALKGEYDRNRRFGVDKELREKAALALGSLGAREAVPVLISALQDKGAKIGAIRALGAIKDESAVPALIKCLADENPMAQRQAALALKEIGTPEALAAFKEFSKDKPSLAVSIPRLGSMTPVDSSKIPRLAAPPRSVGRGYAIGITQGPERPSQKPGEAEIPRASPPPQPTALQFKRESRQGGDINPFLEKLKSKDPEVRREAALRLGDIGNPEAADHLLAALQDENARARAGATYALGNLKEKRAVDSLLRLLKDPDPDVRTAAVTALGRVGDASTIEPISLLLLDRNKEVRDRSVVTLRRFPDPRGMRVLVHHLVENTRRGDGEAEGHLWNIAVNVGEGEKAILQALADPEGNERRTLQNYIRHMEYNIPYVSDISRGALSGYKDRNLLITELALHIRSENNPYYAIEFLGQLKDPKAESILADVLARRKAYSSTAVVGAMTALENLQNKQTPAIVLDILRNPKEPDIVREQAARVLGKRGDRQASDALIGVLKNKKDAKEVRIQAAAGLGSLQDRKAVPPLIGVLKDKGEDEWVRGAAAAALGELGDEKSILPIEEATRDTSAYVKSAAQEALRKIKAER